VKKTKKGEGGGSPAAGGETVVSQAAKSREKRGNRKKESSPSKKMEDGKVAKFQNRARIKPASGQLAEKNWGKMEKARRGVSTQD